MNYEFLWNHIVDHYKNNFGKTEDVVQSKWEEFFSEIFGYMKIYGEIDVHRVIQIGSYKRVIPDIIIRNRDGNDLFDVELKQYNLSFTKEMEDQLLSYMKLISVSVGVIVCQKLYVYFYTPIKNSFKKIEIPFEKNNFDGIKFVELFKKGNFSVDAVEAFIDSKNEFETQVEEIRHKLIESNIIDMVKKCFSDNYSTEVIDFALKDFSISIRYGNVIDDDDDNDNDDDDDDGGTGGGGSQKDYTEYLFEGRRYKKSPLAFAVLKAYKRDNPDITYIKLKAVFPDSIQGSNGVIVTPDEIRGRCSDPDKRYHTKIPIILKDNTVVWVCTQWGKGLNIDRLIKKATELGYTITPLK